MVRPFLLFFLVLLLDFFIATERAYAYVDPGNAAVLLQLLISFIAGAIFFLRNSIRNIINKLLRKKSD